MTLSRRNWFVRFAFIGADWGIPTQVSLCALFWRIVWRLIVVTVLLSLIIAIGFAIWQKPWEFLKGFAAVVGATSFIIGTIYAVTRIDRILKNAQNLPTEELNFAEVVITSIKNRFCPIFEIKR